MTMLGFPASATGLSTVLIAIYTCAKLTTILLIANHMVSPITMHVHLYWKLHYLI
jgi:hypothetical protein